MNDWVVVALYCAVTGIVMGLGVSWASTSCKWKADKMESYAYEWTIFEGCMVKDTEDSPWRDVQR